MDHESGASLRSNIGSTSGWMTHSDTGSAAAPQDPGQENHALQARFAQLQAELAAKQLQLNQGQAEYRERIEDIVALTAHFRGRLEEASAQAQAAETAAQKQQVQDLAQRLDEVTRHRDSLLNSSSWKITAPIRAVMRAFRGY